MEPKREEFAQFYAASKDECLRIVLVAVGNRQLAEDLVAEAFARAWLSWRNVRTHPAPRAWVLRTALNTHVSWWRRRRREIAVDELPQIAAEAPVDGLDARLAAAIRELPPRQREVILLRVFLDLDAGTAAAALGVTPSTVATHLQRALGTLRSQVPTFADPEVSR